MDFPLLFRLRNRLCLVAGGGAVGLRKARALFEAEARVRLVDPSVDAQKFPDCWEVLPRRFLPEDLDGVFLAFAAAGDRQVNAAVAREAKRRGIPVNVADCPEEGDFALPALLRRGELTVGVGTGGLSPLLAMAIRDRLKEQIGAEWETVLVLAAALRQKGLTLAEPGEYNRKVWRLLSGDRLAAAAAAGDAAVIDELLKTHLGEGFSLAQLGVRVPKGKR